ncbi:MAG: BON domain-containing protein, partial [Planctomycetes bacterium]|nr:BON domain-containing protein [Planctomycetota bacterium]
VWSVPRHAYCPLRSVSCECRQGVLFLRGLLPTFYLKQLAQEAVGRVEGISQVVNETVVKASLLSDVRNVVTGLSVSSALALWQRRMAMKSSQKARLTVEDDVEVAPTAPSCGNPLSSQSELRLMVGLI